MLSSTDARSAALAWARSLAPSTAWPTLPNRSGSQEAVTPAVLSHTVWRASERRSTVGDVRLRVGSTPAWISGKYAERAAPTAARASLSMATALTMVWLDTLTRASS